MHQTEQKRYSKTTALVLCGIFAALMAICSFITIPLGFTPVPINLATLGVFLTGGILGKKYGSISLIVYILLGAVGVPVFAGFKGGLGVLAGPTGGYIIGYLAAAFLTGLLVELVFTKTGTDSGQRSAKSSTSRFIGIILAMIAGLAACYALGTAWFMISTGTGLGAALISASSRFCREMRLRSSWGHCWYRNFGLRSRFAKNNLRRSHLSFLPNKKAGQFLQMGLPLKILLCFFPLENMIAITLIPTLIFLL